MPVNTKYLVSFEANGFFHVIAKAAGDSTLFQSDNNRHYFLKKYQLASAGYFETYSYVLLNNHVHWLVKCNSHEGLKDHIRAVPPQLQKTHQQRFLNDTISFEEAQEFQWKDFFISYAMAFNKENNRKGALFINPFRRVQILDAAHFTQLVIYHHANPLKHFGQKTFQNYPWSSYQTILSDKPTQLKRLEVLDWFGGKEQFIKVHAEGAAYYYTHSQAME
ncbi:MAG: hypothetical protein U0V75_00730 [Ferruginibacter sp.]